MTHTQEKAFRVRLLTELSRNGTQLKTTKKLSATCQCGLRCFKNFTF